MKEQQPLMLKLRVKDINIYFTRHRGHTAEEVSLYHKTIIAI